MRAKRSLAIAVSSMVVALKVAEASAVGLIAAFFVYSAILGHMPSCTKKILAPVDSWLSNTFGLPSIISALNRLNKSELAGAASIALGIILLLTVAHVVFVIVCAPSKWPSAIPQANAVSSEGVDSKKAVSNLEGDPSDEASNFARYRSFYYKFNLLLSLSCVFAGLAGSGISLYVLDIMASVPAEKIFNDVAARNTVLALSILLLLFCISACVVASVLSVRREYVVLHNYSNENCYVGAHFSPFLPVSITPTPASSVSSLLFSGVSIAVLSSFLCCCASDEKVPNFL